MGNLISISKASSLLGISRSELNEQLSAANISTFEGKVDFEAVKSIAPAISLCESDVFDRIRYIRENISTRDRDDIQQKSRQNLVADINKLSTDLMVEKRTAQHYETILVQLAQKLGALQSSGNEGVRQMALELCAWLRHEISSE